VWINISKFQTRIWNHCPHRRGEDLTLHGRRHSSEEIYNVEHAALTILCQGQAFRLKSQILSSFLDLEKQARQKNPEFQNLASKEPSWQPWYYRNLK